MATNKRKPKTPRPKQAKPKRVIPPIEVRELGPPDDVSVAAYVQPGMDASIAASRDKTWEERGRLRGGTVGCFVDAETYTGRCLREGAARYLGAEPQRPRAKWRDRRLMLDQGAAVEQCFVDPLIAGLPEGWTATRDWAMETRVGRSEARPEGERWTGREDVCLSDAEEVPRVLVELKNVSSLPTDLLFTEKPKIEHVIQLANYMRVSGLPGQLWYTSRVLWPIPSWGFVTPLLPQSPTHAVAGAEYVEWSKGFPPKASKLAPFMIGFHFRWADGCLWYTRAADAAGVEPNTMWARTEITDAGIEAWYTQVTRVIHGDDGDQLPPPPQPMEVTGDRKHFKACDYCDWSATCAQVQTRGEWLDALAANTPEPNQFQSGYQPVGGVTK